VRDDWKPIPGTPFIEGNRGGEGWIVGYGTTTNSSAAYLLKLNVHD
jgi:hypothetical protein